MNKTNRKLKSICAVFQILILLLCSGFNVIASAENSVEAEKDFSANATNETAYISYYEKYEKSERPNHKITVLPKQYDTTINDKQAFTLNSAENGFVAEFNIPQEGAYHIKLDYCTIPGDLSKIQISLAIDGKYLFDESERIELFRLYEDDIEADKFQKDKHGNDVRPSSKEIFDWQTLALSDYNTMYDEPYIFYLSEGSHTVTVKSENKIAVSGLEFYNEEKKISYKDYIKSFSDSDNKATVRQEAEIIYQKNSDNIYPTFSRTDASILPRSADSIKLNTIGQSNWSSQGQKISWKAAVKEPGLYSLTFRSNQSYKENGSSYRRLLINGEVPFDEAENIEFPYSVRWYNKTLGNKEKPYYVYLEPGDIVTLECVAEENSVVSRRISILLSQMSEVYREIFVITGANPDAYTDYNLDVKLPHLMGELKSIKKSLEEVINIIEKTTGKKTSVASTLAEITETYDNMIERPYDIHRYITSMSDDITNMGSLIITLGEQPLELDCIYFTSKGEEIPSGKVSFFENVKYMLQRFFVSYANDYGSLSKDSSRLKVWVSTGRDQLQIIQQMVESDFENKHSNVKIELSLVDTGATLLQATIAGKGPDVAIMIPTTNSINLAFRDALVDLNNYDIRSVKNNFPESAWTPLYFKDGVYGIPETAVFNMMFYRTDIFEMLNIEPPKTWDEFYEILEILQRNNLEVGIPEIGADAGVSAGIGAFTTFLLQRGGTYYTEDGDAVASDGSIPSGNADKPGTTAKPGTSQPSGTSSEIVIGDKNVEKLDFGGKTFTKTIVGVAPAYKMRMKEAFEKKFNCKIKFVNLPWETYNSQVATSVASGNPYDICGLHPYFWPEAGTQGLYEPLNKYISKSDLMDEKTHIGIDMEKSEVYQLNGKLYGVCTFNGTYTVQPEIYFYNKLMFEDAGIEDPMKLHNSGKWTWDKLFEIAAKVTNKQKGKYMFGGDFAYALGEFVRSDGFESIKTVNGKKMTNFNDPKLPSAIDKGLQFIKNYCSNKGTRDNATEFINGNHYMFQHSVTWGTFDGYDMIQASAAFDYDFTNLGLVPLPFGPNNTKKTYPAMGAQAKAAGKGSKDPRIVVAWVKFASEWKDPMSKEDPSLYSDAVYKMLDKVYEKVSPGHPNYKTSTQTLEGLESEIYNIAKDGGDYIKAINDRMPTMQHILDDSLGQ